MLFITKKISLVNMNGSTLNSFTNIIERLPGAQQKSLTVKEVDTENSYWSSLFKSCTLGLECNLVSKYLPKL